MSAALAHLRFGVTVCAAVLALALAAQTAVWMAVHFTDARVERVAPDPAAPEAPPRVVRSTSPRTADEQARRTAEALREDQPARAEVNIAPGATDALIRRITTLVQAAGVISALLLSVLLLQGVVIAAGAQVPGVERAVTATSLTLLIVLLALPLGRLLPELSYGGVFTAYDTLVAESAAVRAARSDAPPVLTLYATRLFMPLALLAGLIFSTLRFRAGIEAGFIVTAVSELDERVEREIRAAKLGQLAVPRAVGALNMAIGGDPGDTALAASGAAPARAAPPAFKPAAVRPEHWEPGDSTKRPI
ncbi:MAG: hypothetical protein SFZ24_04880 [Planctomycetota bacterium]|nr:hypothetical protein [Planctomycetota bacterium]